MLLHPLARANQESRKVGHLLRFEASTNTIEDEDDDEYENEAPNA